MIKYMTSRRRVLSDLFDFQNRWDMWAESCIPSYCHPNFVAAFISWWRLFAAVKIAGGSSIRGDILDFGSSIGELYHLLPKGHCRYSFVENNEDLAAILLELIPSAQREILEAESGRQFDLIFALDALEHNRDYPHVLSRLRSRLTKNGRMVISGPTESLVYTLGRSVAGFSNRYHQTCIYDIETEIGKYMTRVRLRKLPPLIPLFRLSVWEKRGAREG